ncbi:hypothetical protein FPV67DRAFT_16114 [Lyophyllum atratum]|nr:hypothetical protein FPV67DRAFT_16114 [Lyophyllum atratum]
MPPHNRQDSGYYDPAPSTPWERWQPYEREGCYDVSYIGADHNAAFGPLPEDRVYYESPRIETCHDNDRGHPTIYEREIFAGSGQYGPRQRLSSGIIQQNNSFPRHRAKYAGPYNRQPVDNGWQRNGAGKPNIDDLHQTRSDGGPSPPAVTNTQKSQNAKQNRGHMRRHISQGSNPPSSISPRSTTQRPITPNDSLPLTPHSPVDIRANNMFSTDPSTPQPPMQPSSDSQASQAWLEVAQNVQLVSKTPVDIHLEPATNWDARDGRAPAHTPLATRSEQSMNWEDDYEQPEEAAVVAPDNLAKDCFAPSGSRSVTSLGYGDVTDNPWTL